MTGMQTLDLVSERGRYQGEKGGIRVERCTEKREQAKDGTGERWRMKEERPECWQTFSNVFFCFKMARSRKEKKDSG